MDFIEDEAQVSDEDEVLVPSSQQERIRLPRKRRRLNSGDIAASDDDQSEAEEYDLPSHAALKDIEIEDPEFAQYKSKYEDYMHVPEYAQTPKNTFVTQLTQPWSSPTRMRGPRWKRQSSSPSPALSPIAPSNLNPQLSRGLNGNTASVTSRAAEQPIQRDLPILDEFDDDDPALLEAFMSSPVEIGSGLADTPILNAANAPKTTATTSMRQSTLHGISTTQRQVRASQPLKAHNWPLAQRVEKTTHHIIDQEAMETWVYPTNLGKIRDYQYNIVYKALFHNLLVALPTGLGKTFIAATVMLNWYRWTKEAQIVFVAPTRPLVVQQAKACYEIAGIAKSDTTLMTGEVQAALRAEEWKEKRVFFMTPQTLVNDLKSGIADPKKIVLVVVDEAHKATGNYAYVEAVRFLRRFTEGFRVLALTATPGSSVETVQEVIDGLDIARVEIRTEDSIDIRDFVHSREVRVETFDPSEEVAVTMGLFDSAVSPVLSQITSPGAYYEKRPCNMTLYGLKVSLQKWNGSDAAKVGGPRMKYKIVNIFRVLMSLAHNVELLKNHGIGPFYHKMKRFEEESGAGKYATMVKDNDQYKKMMSYMRSWVNDPEFEGHPKLTHLKEVVMNHFLDAGEGRGANSGRGPAETRIMVFAHYRDSAEEIQRVLKRHEPMIRPQIFVGQSGTKGSEGMNQKTQLEVIQNFKSGVFNTLIATSIGEEGLDIGEVDLIVCYDSSSSPIRMLQRMGRTGRKRAGKIEVLLMRGKEANDFAKAKDGYLKIQQIIESGTSFKFHEDRSSRIVPREIQPVVDKRIVEIPPENTQDPDFLPDPRKRKAKTLKRPPKKFHMPDGVETGFTFLGQGKSKKTKTLPVLDLEIATLPSLELVLMSRKEEEIFDNDYRQVSGTEPQFIQPVSFDSFPQDQRRLQKTSLVGHSKSTRAFVAAVQAMHNSGHKWVTPEEQDIMQTQTFGTKPVQEKAKIQKVKQAKISKADMSRQAPNRMPNGTSETLRSSSAGSIGDYDDNDSFIHDGDETPRARKDTPVTSPMEVSKVGKRTKVKAPVADPWYVSQKSLHSVDGDDELPDFGEIVSLIGATAVSKSNTNTRSNARRVVDSDDE